MASRLDHALNQMKKLDKKPLDFIEAEKKLERNHRSYEFRRKCTRCKTNFAFNRQWCKECMTPEEREKHIYPDEKYSWEGTGE